MKYTITGKPIPLARPRFSHGKAYDSQLAQKSVCKLMLRRIHDKHVLMEGPIHMEVNFYMPIPRTWPLWKKDCMDGKPHILKPDWSNLMKFIEDCATGICYRDDCLIASVSGKKLYSTNPRTELILSEIK